MEDDANIITKESINLNIEDNSLTQGFFSFFLSKKQVISLCPYKDMLIILMNDYTLILYEILNKSKKMEIKEIEKYKPIEIKILYYQTPLFNKDYLLTICEKNILLLNITSFIIEYNLTLKEKVFSSELFVLNNIYFLAISFEFKIVLYSLKINQKENCLLSFEIYQEIPKSNEKIFNMKIFLNTNLLFYQTDKIIFFNTFKVKSHKVPKEFIFDKIQNFKDQIPNKDELNTLNKKLESLYETYKSDKYKSLDIYNNIIIEYTKLNNYFIIAIYNKIFIIQSFYDYLKNDIQESNININKGENYFKILDRITKPNIIISMKIIEPYLILIYEKKIYFYTIFEHNKCIYETNLDPSFDLIFYKPITLLSNLHLINYSEDLINFNDEMLLEEINKNKKNDLSLNSRPIIYTYYNKENKLNYFCFEKILIHIDIIKNINPIYASKFLSSLDYNREKNKNENKQYYIRDLDKKNRKYIEFEVIQLFFDEIKRIKYENALNIYIDNDMNIIFILILIKNFIQSDLLNNLLILTFFEYIYKISLALEKININIINDKDEKGNISDFIKIFFEIIMKKRNEIKNNFTPEELKYTTLDNIINEIKLKSINNRVKLDLDDYNNNIEIIKLIEKKNEDIINFLLLENIIFILNFCSYKISKDYKFLTNLYGLIKMSINILDPNIIDLLNAYHLQNLILLFYFSKRLYEQCFTSIISFYEAAPLDNSKDLDINSTNDNEIFDDIIYLNKNRDNNSKLISTLSEENKPKSYWFQTYIYLISKIYINLSQEEFKNKIQWSLKENSCKTIDLLLQYKIINNKKVDYSFIDLLNPYGLDSIIHYFSIFSNLKGGKTESNEIINLYSIKIKLLNAENTENKFIKEINETRNKLGKFLIKNKNYDLEKAYERIILDISFCEKEIGILLIKKKEYENGLNKIMNFENSDENHILDLIFLIVEEMPSFELIKLIIDKLNIIKFSNNSKEFIILQIMKRVSNDTDILIDILNTNILDEYDNSNFANFFLENIFSLEKKILYNKIEASLIGSQILDHKNILYDKQNESALVNYKTICSKCKRCIYEESEINGENVFGVKTNNGKIYHLNCFNDLKNKD